MINQKGTIDGCIISAFKYFTTQDTQGENIAQLDTNKRRMR